MNYLTGETIYDIITSTDAFNNPVFVGAVTFVSGSTLYKDGIIYPYVSMFFSVLSVEHAIYSVKFTPFEIGTYQMYINNIDADNFIYVSYAFNVVDSNKNNVYVGL